MYKLGRLPRNKSRWAPAVEDYMRPHPVSKLAGLEKVADSEDVDRAARVTSWPMYCNGPDEGNPPGAPDGCGDCTIAEMAHAYTALDVYAGKPPARFDDAEVISVYSRNSGFDPVTGENDNGCEMMSVLRDQRDVGMRDADGNIHKVLMFAELRNPRNTLLLSQVLKTFGYVYLGISCPESAEEQFGNGPWTYVPGSPIVGGHCIGLHRRNPYGSRIGVFQMASWGALQPATIGFIQNYVEEAWAVITPDWVEANGSTCDGIALAQLEADMRFV